MSAQKTQPQSLSKGTVRNQSFICDAHSIADDQRLDGPQTLALIFGSREALSDRTVFDAVRAALPTSILAGCSTAGHFVGEEIADDQLSVSISRFEHTRLRQATTAVTSPDDSAAAGARLAAELAAPDLRAVLVLSDGTHCNGSALVDGLVARLGPDVVIFGGLAADGDAFIATRTLDSARSAGQVVTAVGLMGDNLSVSSGSRAGWDPFGPERAVTKASGSTLYELDGEPALDLYIRYLGERADELPGSALLFPLGVRDPAAPDSHQVIRTVLGVDHAAKSMTFAGDVPQGWRAQLMRAGFDALVDGAADAAVRLGRVGDVRGDTLCLGVSCVGRRLVLGSRTEDELAAVVEELGHGAHLVGFYSYGELAPGESGACELHNQTMTLTAIGET